MTAIAPDALTLARALEIVRDARSQAGKRGGLVWIYVIQAGGTGSPVKIGIAKDPRVRVATLQQANSERLRGIAAWRGLPVEEKLAHQWFAHARIRGEWFHPTTDLMTYARAMGGEFEDWA